MNRIDVSDSVELRLRDQYNILVCLGTLLGPIPSSKITTY